MFKPDFIVLDYETTGLEFYRNDFRVLSAAFSWLGQDGQIKSKFIEREPAVKTMVARIAREGIPVIVHNAQFEIGVTACRFPGISLNWYADVMRLAQVADNGGKEAQRYTRELTLDEELEGKTSEPETGLGLTKVVSRWLPQEYHDHKEPYYQWLRDHGVKKGKEGEHLYLLPPDMLKAYNVADTENTLRLYLRFMEYFKEVAYDWRLDHRLYLSSVHYIHRSKTRGVKVDRERLAKYRDEIAAEIAEIENRFRERFKREIDAIEQERLVAWCGQCKAERDQIKRWLKYAESPIDPNILAFNPRSTKQLAELFVEKLKIPVKFYTKESKQSQAKRKLNPDMPKFVPSPSFKASHLHTYGEGGEMLVNLKKRQLVLTQVNALLELSDYDGRWHIDLRACGTTTGRFAGGNSG